jgi:hypothetical protein
MASPWLQLGSRFLVRGLAGLGKALGKALPKSPFFSINPLAFTLSIFDI